jgi:uncharacterized protein with HEPN domain
MKKTTSDYLRDMRQYVSDIQTFTIGFDKSAFKADRKTQLAVIRAFEVIGEIAKRLPQSLLDQKADVDWRAVQGFRDILIHQYDNVDLDIVWDAVGQAAAVQKAVEALLASLPADDQGEE